MKKYTKLFKIGECAYYGKWRVTVKNPLTIIAEGINYGNNMIMISEKFDFSDYKNNAVMYYFEEVSNFYYAEKINEFIGKAIKKCEEN